MPGLVGIVSSSSIEQNRRDLQIMIGSMMHEPSYRKREYIDEEAGLYLGAISHQGATDDCMPVFNEERDIILIFSGETFTDTENVQSLARRGHDFKQNSVEYLVHLYEEEGEEFYEKLNGWFCGVLVDKRKKLAVIFNDRYGMRRLYYSTKEGAVRFSTEAKALFQIDNMARAFDKRGLLEYFVCGCPLQERTLFEGIHLLPGGSRWIIINKSVVEKSRYFDISTWENKETLPLEFFYPRLRETFRRILPIYLMPNPSIGISLTGGLDTRMIMANAALKPGQIPCYSFSGMYRDCYDAKIARKVAYICGQDHVTIRLGKDFLNQFPMYAEKTIKITEGSIDLNAAPDLYMNAKVKKISSVRLTGNYGSEVLRGVRWLQGERQPNAIASPDLNAGLAHANALISELNKKHPLTFTLFCDGPWHEYGRYAIESSQLVQRTPYMDNELVSLMYQAPTDAASNKLLSIRLIADGNPALIRIPTDRGFPLDERTPKRMFYRFLFEGLFKAEYVLNYGAPQWLVNIEHFLPILRLEKLFLGRHKFYHFRSWFRDELSGYIKEILLDRLALGRPFFNSENVEKMVILHTSGKGNFTREIHIALNLELTSRIILEC